MPRRPSPTTIIALAALFFSLGGTAIAARHYLLTSTSQIKPSVLRQLRSSTGQPGPSGAQGPAGIQGATGSQGAAGAPATALWAAVTNLGILVASDGVTGLVSDQGEPAGGPVFYTVTFNRDVSHCARIATLAVLDGEGGLNEPGQIFAGPGMDGNSNSITVYTYNAHGEHQFRSFSLAVFC